MSCATQVSPRGPSLALWAIHLVPRLRRLSGLCSSNVSDPANRLRKTRKKKSSAVPLFRSGHMSAICARLSRGKAGVQRGRETAGVPSFLPPRRVPRRSRRPQTANPLAEVQRKTFRPLGANTLTQFVSPAQPVLKKGCRLERANTPAAVRVPQLVGAENIYKKSCCTYAAALFHAKS